MGQNILLITPPFTQLNTPYPATPYLKGFLKSRGYGVVQADLGIELTDRVFSREGFEALFDQGKKCETGLSPNSLHIIQNEHHYVQTVDRIMNFLRYRDNTTAQRICHDEFLPRASRFSQMPDLEWAFGSIGVNDKARYFATLYIEDMGDFIRDAVAPYFGFSRYAEKLGLSASSFKQLDRALRLPDNVIESWLGELLKRHFDRQRPDVVGVTIPFPGNLYGALKCCRFIRNHFPTVRIVAGGGFVNTELRELSDPALFEYLDFLTLDDGELPFLHVLQFLRGDRTADGLTRTFIREGKAVKFCDDRSEGDVPHRETGCPDYSDLPLDRYLSLIEIANPMHRLWSDGRWNKLTLAHGCYWHRCSFCDTSLDYIRRYESAPAGVLADRISQVIEQTGQTGFHFVDEAAPPAVLKELALELLRRKIGISWWSNIRFEQTFSRDLCRLLAASGCIAVTGGLETASDRLLKLMNKGITIRQAARACRNFSDAGIMVHAYLMYGFPTQTGQETIDSLDIVRQFFSAGLIQSAFWHEFTATVHSDIGRHPENYHIRIPACPAGGFAHNNLPHEDPSGCDHQAFAQGLKKAVYNFMHGIGTDFPVQDWFDFQVTKSSVRGNYVERAITGHDADDRDRMKSTVLWLGNRPCLMRINASGKGRASGQGRLYLSTKQEEFSLSPEEDLREWFNDLLNRLSVYAPEPMTLQDIKGQYEETFAKPFDSFMYSSTWKTLREKGLLLV